VGTTSWGESSRKCTTTTTPCPAASTYFLPLQFQQNLRDYLTDIKNAGFERVSLALGPQWINDFYSCNSTDIPVSLRSQLYAGSSLVNELFEEAWGVAKEVRAAAAGSGLPYLIDLGNEYMPPSNIDQYGTCAKEIVEGKVGFPGYLRYLWGQYTATYGRADTVGFSVIVGHTWDADNRLARMPQFLSPLPSVLELHSYSNGTTSTLSAALARAYDVSRLQLGNPPWVIGETENRSTVSASVLRSFLLSKSQNILYVLQWPGFNCSTASECAPLDFRAFSSQGM